VLLYAFIFNGEKSRAMINPVAMRGEVKLGLIVGFIFPYPVYLGAKQALSRRAMGRRVASIATTVHNQAVNRLEHLSHSGGYRCFRASNRIPSTRRRDHPREQVSFDPQPSFERYDSHSRIRFKRFGMAMRFPRRLLPLVLENKRLFPENSTHLATLSPKRDWLARVRMLADTRPSSATNRGSRFFWSW
jgi:hypothetical protein